MTRKDLAAMYGVGPTTVSRWRVEIGKSKKPLHKPVPPDFVQAAEGRCNQQVARHYGVGEWMVRKWRAMTPVPGGKRGGSQPKPVPEDFGKLAVQMSNYQLAAHYGTSRQIISRWRSMLGINISSGSPKALRPRPNDFREIAVTMGNDKLARHYSAAIETVRRWRVETQAWYVPALRPKKVPAPRKPRYRQPPQSTSTIVRLQTLQGRIPPRDTSLLGTVADFLRQARRYRIHRCTEGGGADQAGKFWRVENAVLTDDELIARAERWGWSADRWAA